MTLKIENPPPYLTIDAPRFHNPARTLFIEKLPGAKTHWLIPSKTPHRCRRLLERMGYFLKREQRFDCPPYDADICKEKQWGHLLGQTYGANYSYAIGGACFDWVEWTDREPSYCLEWIWIHPYFRRQGLLKSAWITFLARYGNFVIAPPVSHSMHAFLQKVGHPDAGKMVVR